MTSGVSDLRRGQCCHEKLNRNKTLNSQKLQFRIVPSSLCLSSYLGGQKPPICHECTYESAHTDWTFCFLKFSGSTSSCVLGRLSGPVPIGY